MCYFQNKDQAEVQSLRNKIYDIDSKITQYDKHHGTNVEIEANVRELNLQKASLEKTLAAKTKEAEALQKEFGKTLTN